MVKGNKNYIDTQYIASVNKTKKDKRFAYKSVRNKAKKVIRNYND